MTTNPELDFARRQVELYDTEYEELVSRKRQIELELNDPASASTLTVAEHKLWRMEKIKAKVDCEVQLGRCKLQRKKWRMEYGRLEGIEYSQRKYLEQSDDLEKMRRETERLRKQVCEWESKYLTLERQYDAVVRQLNAIPKAVR